MKHVVGCKTDGDAGGIAEADVRYAEPSRGEDVDVEAAADISGIGWRETATSPNTVAKQNMTRKDAAAW